MSTKDNSRLIGKGYMTAFIMVVSLFAFWGFANDITNPLVRAFQDIFLISSAQSSLVQTAFYGGYATMAIPAALFIRRYTYKSGILLGLALYATGALIFIPASITMNFWVFLIALYILTFGLAFLETTANPYILSLGDPSTATRRLNLAQAFNPLGSLTGMAVANFYILNSLDVFKFQDAKKELYANVAPDQLSELARSCLEMFALIVPDSFKEMQMHDLAIVRMPYMTMGIILIVVFLIFLFKKMPQIAMDENKDLNIVASFNRIIKNKIYIMGVFAQTFYVGAQIMCWTYVIHYGMSCLNLTAAEAGSYNICAMVLFCISRFVCTYLLKFFNSGTLLMVLSVLAGCFILGTIYLEGFAGLYCLVGVSGCMSLMFPTIYGIALDGMGDDAKFGSAGLIFAIVGGALMPPLQGRIIDMGEVFGLMSVRASFFLPFVCFVMIAIYGFVSQKHIHEKGKLA